MTEIIPDYRIASDFNLEKIAQLLKSKPDDGSLLFALGELALRRGRNLVALSAFTRLLEVTPKIAEVHLALAKIFAEQKMLDEAFREVAESLEIDPANVEARVLYEIFIREGNPSSEKEARLKNSLRESLDSQKVKLYLQRLGVERDLLRTDEREISDHLAKSPEETLLEYNRAVVERKLARNEQLFSKAEELSGLTREKQKLIESALPSKAKKREAKPEASLAHRARVILALVQALNPFLQKINHIQGIVAVFLTGLTGEFHHTTNEEHIPSAEVMKTVSGSLELLWGFAPDLAFWVMEFEQGLAVLQTIAPKLFLLILTDATVTFGALRYTLDKMLPLIQNSIRSIEVSGLEQ